MIINSVYIKNFRGIKGEKNFLFKDRKFILLSASNGKGKTTIIDAIEWCLTGNIGRLANSYDARSTNNEERKKNVDGLLKNKNCLEDEEISVTIKIEFKGTVYDIQRTQTKDILNEKDSKVFIDGKTQYAKKFLGKFVDKNFYNYYFCDVQKTFNLLSKKRSELPELFTEFISDYSREENIVQNLDIFQDDIDRKIEEQELKKTSDKEISSYQEILEKYKKAPNIVPYNKEKMYEEEEIECSKMNFDEISAQLAVLYKCGYCKVYDILQEVNSYDTNKNFIQRLKYIVSIVEKKEGKINKAVELGFQKDYSKITDIESEINKLKKIELKTTNFQLYVQMLINLKNPKFTQVIYNKKNGVIQEATQKIENLDKEIGTLTKGNAIIESLSTLASNKEGIVEYRNRIKKDGEIANCPLCGSSIFDSLDEENILKKANEYLGEHEQLIVGKKKEKEDLMKEKDTNFEDLIKIGNEIIKIQIKSLEEKYSVFNDLKKDTEEFFKKIFEIIKGNPSKYTTQNLCSKDFLLNEVNLLKNQLQTEAYINEKRTEYHKILTLLGYTYGENENENTTFARMNSLKKECPEIIKFSIDILNEKINSLKSLISNNEYLTIQNKIKAALTNNKNIKNEIKKLNELKNIAKERAEIILNIVMELKENEYEKVGPFLHKFYRKLSRVESIKDISVIDDSGKISLHDEKDKSLLNVLSNGQLSVFMLAYFLGGAVSRNLSDKFKVYFIDDLTACMDDINMLAFIDFLKYLLMENNGFMEQIFFVTCDDRVRRLIQYKMKGGGIEFTELGEEAFA